MKIFYKGICAASVAFASFVSIAADANAAPLPVVRAQAGENLHEVQFRRDEGRQRFDRRRVERPRFERRGGSAYYNGRRGYREYRRGYRQYNGWWFPSGAFVAGAIIGGAIANQPTVQAPVRLNAAHVQWCQNRWRSYRVSDNSYQPYNGSRQVCVSPYFR
jgi:hypothetical protein